MLGLLAVGCGPAIGVDEPKIENDIERSEVELAFVRIRTERDPWVRWPTVEGAEVGEESLELFAAPANTTLADLGWSRDGRWLAVSVFGPGLEREVVIIGLETGEAEGFAGLSNPVWSVDPDVLFASRSGDSEEPGVEFVRLDVATGDISVMKRGVTFGALSPQGTTNAHECRDLDAELDFVCLEDLETGEVRRIEVPNEGRGRAEDLAWSPDAKWLAFTARNYGQFDYHAGYTLDAASMQLNAVAEVDLNAFAPVWNAGSEVVSFGVSGNHPHNPHDYFASEFSPRGSLVAEHRLAKAVSPSADGRTAVVFWRGGGGFSSPTFVAVPADGEVDWRWVDGESAWGSFDDDVDWVSSTDENLDDKAPVWRRW